MHIAKRRLSKVIKKDYARGEFFLYFCLKRYYKTRSETVVHLNKNDSISFLWYNAYKNSTLISF